MNSQSLACPNCGNTHTRKASVIYESGCSTTQLSGVTTAPSLFVGSGSSITELADRFAPPQKRKVGLLALAGVFALVVGLTLSLAMLTMKQASSETIVMGIPGLMLVTVGIWWIIQGVKQIQNARRFNQEIWPQRREEWTRMMHCDRCDHAFVPQDAKLK